VKPTQPWVSLVGRIACSYAIAVLAAGISIGLFLALMMVIQPLGDRGWPAILLGPIFLFLLYGGMFAIMIAIYAFAPFVLAICALRFFNRVDWFSHALAGSLVGVVAIGLVLRRVPDPGYILLMPVPGFVLGIIYWATFRDLSNESVRPQETMA